MTKVRYCAQCRSGGTKIEAEVEAKGFIRGYYSDRRVPYHGFLCDEHYSMLTDDGAELRIVEYLGEARHEHAAELVRKHTYYDGLQDFLACNPTIRDGHIPEAGWLRNYYREETGRKCFA